MKIILQLQLIVQFTVYSVKSGCYQRGGPAVTVLLVSLNACSSSRKTLCPLTETALLPPSTPYCYYSLLDLLISIHLLSSLLCLFLCLSSSSSLSTFILCSLKAIGALLSMLRTTVGCLVGREDKHWQGTSFVLPPTTISASGPHLTFPQSESLCSNSTSSRLQTSHSLSTSLYHFPHLPSDSVWFNYGGISMLQGQKLLEIEGKCNKVDRLISYQYRLFWRTRPPPPHSS